MIKHLHISNYALIESLRIDFAPGLTIITGETGAGKSILLGALGLVMGKRADTKVLLLESKKCVVEAFFDIRSYDLRDFFTVHDLDYDDELVIRREVLPSGRSRAFVNDVPATLNIVQQLSSALIDLHEQFDTLDIHEVSFQLRMIDALAGHGELLAEYQQVFAAYESDRRELEAMRQRNAHASREVEFIRFQLDELLEARLQAGEQQQLEGERSRLGNAESIKQVLGEVHRRLEADELSIDGLLEELTRRIGQIRSYDDRLEPIDQRFEALLIELRDLAREIEGLAEATEGDPERLAEIEERLGRLYRLQTKHGLQSVEELLDLQRDLQAQMEDFGDLGASIERLERQISQREARLEDLGGTLRGNRERVIPDFEAKVLDRLAQLAMPNARLEVAMTPLAKPGPTGLDEVQFRFAANLGSRLQAIRDVASGGELSRLTLVTKSLVASAIPLPSLIFDEIDAGVSGDVAIKMGAILRDLSDQHQVITITHSPQIASQADRHYFVYKRVLPEAQRTVTEIRLLAEEERVRAIATMLSQNPPSASAIANARELLNYEPKS